MATLLFSRVRRDGDGEVGGGEIMLTAPPELPRAVPVPLLSRVLPMVMLVGMLGMGAVMISSGAIRDSPYMLMFPLMMLGSMVGMFAGQSRSGGGTAELNETRREYLQYLDDQRRHVKGVAWEQRRALVMLQPAPDLLVASVGSVRMWERSTEDPDFGHVRIGLGDQRLETRLVPPDTGPVADLEPLTALALRRFVRAHSIVPALPTAVSLTSFPAVSIEGELSGARALARAMICSVATWHSPTDVRIAVIAGEDAQPAWEWMKWLPHARLDSIGTPSALFADMGELVRAVGDDLQERAGFDPASPAIGRPHWIVLLDGPRAALMRTATVEGSARQQASGVWASGQGWPGEDLGPGDDADRETGPELAHELLINPRAGVTFLDLCDAGEPVADVPQGELAGWYRGLELVVRSGVVGARAELGVEDFASVDSMSLAGASALARRMSRFRPDTDASRGPDHRARRDWPEAVGVRALLAQPAGALPGRHGRARLRVPIGHTPEGEFVELDLKEAADGGMGPHGLCVGATGSGKSEFLRTLVLGLAATHSPDQLNLVLVDFKGGATFLGFSGLPHVAAVITNLADESAMVDRMRDALAGELTRRQELLRTSGQFASVGEYECARASGAPLAPLPALFIVIDEFSELLAQQPECIELFVAIGRLGRSLHVHLLLASQRLDEGRLRGLDSHLSYRIGLRTFSATESRSVLGVADAYHLPNVPGAGYLRTDADDLVRFNAAYVSGPFAEQAHVTHDGPSPQLTPALFRGFGAGAAVPVSEADGHGTASHPQQTLVERVVQALASSGGAAHQIWLEPLGSPPPLEQLANTIQPLCAVLGVVDLPFHQRRELLIADLGGGAGNLVVVGAPQSGKSQLLRTLVTSLAGHTSAAAVQFYCLDFGGGVLSGLRDVPHVGAVANRSEPDLVRRIVAQLTGILRDRESRFRALGVESMAQYRAVLARAAHGHADAQADEEPVHDDFGDVFLVIDGFGSIRQDFDQLEQPIINLATQGLSYGVHVVVSCSRWGELRPAMKDQLGTRLELRLGDPMDSEFGRKIAQSVPAGRPGRGVISAGHHILVADSSRVRIADEGIRAPRVQLLPDRITVSSLRENSPQQSSGLTVAIGVDEQNLMPVVADLAAQTHLLIFGDVGAGKTNLLRVIGRSLAESNPPEQVKLVVVDPRRSLLGYFGQAYVAGYAANSAALSPLVSELVAALESRLPPADVSATQLRERSWWSGPEIVMLVDDFDLVSGNNGQLLAALVPLIPHAGDIGFHLVLARRSGGAGRALFDPVIAAVRENSSAGLVLSGNRDEGYLLGMVRPTPLPPGRGTWVTRSREVLIQSALDEG